MKALHDDHGVPQSLLNIAVNILNWKTPEEGFGRTIIEFDKVIGSDELVEVTENDDFYEKRRGNRPYMSRFVKGKSPVPTNKLCVVWKKTPKNFKVITAYFTSSNLENCPDEPGNVIRKYQRGDKDITLQTVQESLDFWSKHAFVE